MFFFLSRGGRPRSPGHCAYYVLARRLLCDDGPTMARTTAGATVTTAAARLSLPHTRDGHVIRTETAASRRRTQITRVRDDPAESQCLRANCRYPGIRVPDLLTCKYARGRYAIVLYCVTCARGYI